MGTLTPDAIARAAAAAGFSGDDLVTAVAVAMAESGGNPLAHNGTPPDDSYGLWQINMLGSMGPQRRKAFGIKADRDLFDPVTNARAAKIVHGWQGWRAWSVYLHGTYRAHLDAARTAVAGIGAPPVRVAPTDQPWGWFRCDSTYSLESLARRFRVPMESLRIWNGGAHCPEKWKPGQVIKTRADAGPYRH